MFPKSQRVIKFEAMSWKQKTIWASEKKFIWEGQLMDIYFFNYENLELISQYYTFKNMAEETGYIAFNF